MSSSESRLGWGRFGSLDVPPEMLSLLAGSASFCRRGQSGSVSSCVGPLLRPASPTAMIDVPAPPVLPVPLRPASPTAMIDVPAPPVLPVPPAFYRHSAGGMIITCPFCSARFFADEAVSCCAHGNVDLPLWRPPPEPLLSLLADQNFRLKIRGYNCALSLGSSVFDDLTASSGPATFKMAGRSWHLLPHSVHPTLPGDHKTAQVYTLPVHEATERRVVLTSGPRRTPLRCDWLSSLHSMLLSNNILVRSFVQSSCDDRDWNVCIGALESADAHAVAANETMVGLLVNGGCERRSVVIPQHGDGSLVIVSDLDPFYQPLHFVLLFPYGDPQWGLHLHRMTADSRKRKRDTMPPVTIYDYLKFHLQRRSPIFGSNVSIHSFGRLFEEWIVDSFLQCENHKLRWFKQNQGLFRRDKFSAIQRQLFDSVPPRQIGSPATHLPSSFVRGYRFYRELYADAMTLPAYFGSIDYFLTFTTNPQWPEITANASIADGMNSPDLYCRVFYIKMKALLIDVLQHGILGTVVAYAWSVEFQQRGWLSPPALHPCCTSSKSLPHPMCRQTFFHMHLCCVCEVCASCAECAVACMSTHRHTFLFGQLHIILNYCLCFRSPTFACCILCSTGGQATLCGNC
jgi:hypothetical protein